VTSSNAETERLISAQSSTVIAASSRRSAMICNVIRPAPSTATRTTR
jgi:hypothetical protein